MKNRHTLSKYATSQLGVSFDPPKQEDGVLTKYALREFGMEKEAFWGMLAKGLASGVGLVSKGWRKGAVSRE